MFYHRIYTAKFLRTKFERAVYTTFAMYGPVSMDIVTQNSKYGPEKSLKQAAMMGPGEWLQGPNVRGLYRHLNRSITDFTAER